MSLLPHRAQHPYSISEHHLVLDAPLEGPWPDGLVVAYFGMGCFWGAERIFWQLDGVYSTAVGYQGGGMAHPLYEEVCSGLTGHAEVVQVVYDPAVLSEGELMRAFFTAHDPTQGNRQGNDVGTQYRSAIFWTTPAQRAAAIAVAQAYAGELASAGFGPVTTDMRSASEAGEFYYAEDYHQQYLAKNPNGYCGIAGTGVSCPMPVGPTI